MRRVLRAALLTVVLSGASFSYFLYHALTMPSGMREVQLSVEKGTSLHRLTHLLGQEEIIRHPWIFYLYARVSGRARLIQAGDYTFPPQQTALDVLDRLMKGSFRGVRVVFPEGWTCRQMAERVASLGIGSAEIFVERCGSQEYAAHMGFRYRSLEGFLYPDTYELSREDTIDGLVRKMLVRFREIYTMDFHQRAREMGKDDYEILILASLIEKETATRSEMPLIASVFYNRLKIGMPLATDPSVIYGIRDFDGNLTREHLKTPGVYNSYLNQGLPPTPICNPGVDALKAALWPAESNYLYFVSKNNGEHHFSTSLQEHNRAVYEYQVLPFQK